MKLYLVAFLAATVNCRDSTVDAFQFLHRSCSRLHHVSFSSVGTTSTATTTTHRSRLIRFAFGLPDEDRQLSKEQLRQLNNDQSDDDDDDEEEEDKKKTDNVADDTLESLVKKLDKSKEKESSSPPPAKKKDNKSMAFLRKIGRVGGAANKSFVNAVGSDEGSTGRQPAADKNSGGGGMKMTKKSKLAYKECTDSGIIDDCGSEPFPFTTSGNEWRGVTDRVMGGSSNGRLQREPDLEGRPANVLIGHVSLKNNGGFIQMVTDLPLDATQPAVDASEFDGIEIDVLYKPQQEEDDNNSFNIHLRTPGTLQQASYRYTFAIQQPNKWETIRVPFSSFEAYGIAPDSDMPPTVDPSELKRIGIVGIGKEMDIYLAVGGVRFYSVI